jgi:uncharacterized iron-regulated membrane protein
MNRKIILQLHLWLGLSTGLLVFVIAITGCLYAFKDEIQLSFQSFRKVEVREELFLPPSHLKNIACKIIPNKEIHAIMYPGKGFAAKAIFYKHDATYYDIIYLNPYDGKILKIKDETQDFFRWVLIGHYYLFLPPDIGQPLVAYVTLFFFIIILSGFILWIPKNWKHIKQRLLVKWDAKWRRVNFDLHQVIGVYTLLFSIIFIFTGLMWGLKWYRTGVYNILSGDKKYEEYYEPLSKNVDDKSTHTFTLDDKIDFIWKKLSQSYPSIGSIEIHFPEDSTKTIATNFNPDISTIWKMDFKYFDLHTLKEVAVTHPWGNINKASKVDLLFRMNYDIHVGSIAGLPGKCIAFFSSLLIASLPITGFLLWKGKRYKNK